jgi:hypothetical protein
MESKIPKKVKHAVVKTPGSTDESEPVYLKISDS